MGKAADMPGDARFNVPFDAVVFDLDGTLIDSAPDIARALNRTLAEFGRRAVSLDEVRAMVGDGAKGLVRDAFAATGAALDDDGDAVAALQRYLDNYYLEDAAADCLYPGVAETLTGLAATGLRLGLCTNKSERICRKVIAQVGLSQLFSAVAGGDSLPVKKPNPGHLRHVAEALGGGRVAMVGDNANDVKAARGCGWPVAAVSYGYPRMPVAELGADVVIDRFTDLPGALRRLGGACG